jgi:predicted membrane protein
MSIFEGKTIKPRRSGLWIYAPAVLLALVGLFIANTVLIPQYLLGIILFLVFVYILIRVLWKIANYFSPENKEMREYEKEMKKRGRR